MVGGWVGRTLDDPLRLVQLLLNEITQLGSVHPMNGLCGWVGGWVGGLNELLLDSSSLSTYMGGWRLFSLSLYGWGGWVGGWVVDSLPVGPVRRARV